MCLFLTGKERVLSFCQFHILYAEVQGKRSFIILDFYCHQARLVIEADGLYHTSKKQQIA
ncbi:MAG: DUF559 domain-containing protein [Saprospiraceae bacterium]|nr:DUF559 domain-containing protein [Saprospiraceae bacterium]